MPDTDSPALASVERIVIGLEAVQWDDLAPVECVWCGGFRSLGHKDDCEIGSALSEARQLRELLKGAGWRKISEAQKHMRAEARRLYGIGGEGAVIALDLLADAMDDCPDCGGFASGHDCPTCLAIDRVRHLLRKRVLGLYATTGVNDFGGIQPLPSPPASGRTE